MDWLLLIVVVPLVIVPIVLLYGFAGCASFSEASSPPIGPPFELVAIPVSTTQINLTWKHASAGGVTFIVSLATAGAGLNKDYKRVTGQFSAECTGLLEGTTYTFSVRAAVGATESAESNSVTTRTFRWEIAYNNPLNDQSADSAGATIVQRIDKTLLNYSDVAREVRLTLRATASTPAAPLVLTEVTLSHVARPGDDPLNPSPDPYDSASPLEKFGQISLPGDGQALTLPARKFVLDRTRDLIVAFDVSATNTTNTRRTITGVGTSMMFRRGNMPLAAAVGNRSGAYTEFPTSVFLVEKIEVLTTKT